MNKHTAVLTLVTGLAITVAFQACGGIHENPGTVSDSGSSLGAAGGAGLASFSSGFYAFTKTQGCVRCHGSFQSPKFADPDINVAYSYFVNLVDPSAPTNSPIILYAGNGHCSDTPCSDPSVRPQVTSLLLSWAAAVNASGGIGTGGAAKYLTGTLAIPTTLPKLTAAPAVLRFPLSMLGIPTVSGALFEIELNDYGNGDYRVARAKIMGNTGTITVSGIHVYVKPSSSGGIGLEDANQGMAWANITAVVNASVLPTKLPTTPLTATPMVTAALGVAKRSTSDMMTIGFDNIVDGAVVPAPSPTPTPMPTPTPVPTVVHFSDLVSSNQSLGIFTQSCVGCHSGGSPAAGLDLTNYAMAQAISATILSRVNSAAKPMPPSGQLPATARQVISNWVNGGAIQ